MRGSVRVGRLGGVPLELHWSAGIGVVLLGLLLATAALPGLAPGRSAAGYALAGACAAVGLLVSLVLHETAHAVVARRNGLRVRRVTIWLLGGVSELQDTPRTPGVEVRVSVVGPLTSVALGVLAGAGAAVLGPVTLPGAVLWWLAVVNVVIGLFNLLPGTPLDGGRVLHGVLWRLGGDRGRATRLSSTAGRLIGALLAAFGVLLVFAGRWDGLWIMLVGWFLAGSASAEGSRAVVTENVRGVTAATVMTPDPVTAPGWTTVAAFASSLARPGGSRHRTFPVVDVDGDLQGVVTLADLLAVPEARRAAVPVRDAVRGAAATPTATEDEPLEQVLERPTGPDGCVVVLRGRRPVGLITRSDLARAVELATLTGQPTTSV